MEVGLGLGRVWVSSRLNPNLLLPHLHVRLLLLRLLLHGRSPFASRLRSNPASNPKAKGGCRKCLLWPSTRGRWHGGPLTSKSSSSSEAGQDPFLVQVVVLGIHAMRAATFDLGLVVCDSLHHTVNTRQLNICSLKRENINAHKQ